MSSTLWRGIENPPCRITREVQASKNGRWADSPTKLLPPLPQPDTFPFYENQLLVARVSLVLCDLLQSLLR